MGTQIAALFDIDGTIFRDSLAVEHFNHLVKYDVIPKEAKLLMQTSDLQELQRILALGLRANPLS